MIIYHPLYDSYHSIVRTLKLLQSLEQKPYEKDRLKIYDYFLLFTHELKSITMPRDFLKYKDISKRNRFNKVHDAKNTFIQLGHAQELGFSSMISYGFIDREYYLRDLLKINESDIANKITLEYTESEEMYIEFIKLCFEKLPLRELKERTNLMEYRYELIDTK